MIPNHRAIRNDARILRQFVEIFCREKHSPRPEGPTTGKSPALCRNCRDLLAYSLGRRRKCPFDPKPACRNCTVQCYQQARRQEIRQVMRFGAIHLASHGRLDKLIGMAFNRGK